MKSWWRLRNKRSYRSVRRVESRTMPGVWLTIRRMSFERRIELARRIRELAKQKEYLEAGTQPEEKIAAALLGANADRVYFEWGVEKVEGLLLDGVPATPARLLAAGPEELVREALSLVKAECGLTEEERKN